MPYAINYHIHVYMFYCIDVIFLFIKCDNADGDFGNMFLQPAFTVKH